MSVDDWSRRTVLAALGLSPLAIACGGTGGKRKRETVPAPSMASTRETLRELVASMSARFPYAAALAVARRRSRGFSDASRTRFDSELRTEVVFTAAEANGAIRERATTDISPDGLAAAAADLLAEPGRRAELSRGADIPVALAGDPRKTERWLPRIEKLYRRALRHGGSRVVHRAAYLDIDDADVIYVGDGRDVAQRIVRTRAGVLFVGSIGRANHADVAERAGATGIDDILPNDDELEAAADDTLSLLTARPIAAGEHDLVLAPSVSGLLAARCVAPALTADRWNAGDSAAAPLRGHSAGSEHVTLLDDPTLAGGYGSYAFDDEGRAADGPTRLIDAGVVAQPLTARAAVVLDLPRTPNGRRAGPLWPAMPSPSNLFFAAGSAGTREQVIASVDDGLLLEGGESAHGAPTAWSATVRIARAREIKGGKLTGRLYGPVLLVDSVPRLLAGVTAASDTVERRAAGAMSMGGPYLVTRGKVA